MTRTLIHSLSAALLVAVALGGCSGPLDSQRNMRDPRTQKWLDRARTSYRVADLEDASDAVDQALRVTPDDSEVRMIAAQVAMARLDYPKALKLSEGISTTESFGLRGRANWYMGNIEAAGNELQQLLRDPEVRDNWAKSVMQLINRGAGRKPYAATGNIVSVTEMPRIRGTAMVIPVEIDGEQGLAMISTSTTEVVLDSAQRKEPSWVSIKISGKDFRDSIEYQDVPALTQDLSGVAKQLGIPSIKALLGVNFIRHANATMDFMAQQFVVRKFQPPRPPNATDVPIAYIRGGAMTFRGALNADNTRFATLMIDTATSFPIALDAQGWRKAGVDPTSLHTLPNEPKLKEGVVPFLRFGAFDIPQLPGVAGVELANVEETLQIDLDGVVGSGLLSGYRLTLGDGGKVLWVEEELAGAEPSSEPPPAPTGSGAPPGVPSLMNPPGHPNQTPVPGTVPSGRVPGLPGNPPAQPPVPGRSPKP